MNSTYNEGPMAAEAMKVKSQPEHIQIARKMAEEVLRFEPDYQNEMVATIRNISIETREREAMQLREKADYLLESCKRLNS